MPPKKPICLTLHEKALIIQELKCGASVTSLSRKYAVAKSTICRIKNHGEVILSAVSSTESGPGKRRTLRESKHPEMEKKLYKWFLSKRKQSVSVSGDMIKEKAKALHADITDSVEFSASDGWLQRFKQRFGIRCLKMSAKELPSRPALDDHEPLQEHLKSKVAELQRIWIDGQTGTITESRDILNMLIPQVEFTDTDEADTEKEDKKLIPKVEFTDTDEGNTQTEENTDEDGNGNKTEETEEKPKITVTPESAINALNTAIQWAEENGIDCNYIQALSELREKAVMQIKT